ncbi:hypothetical protein [Halocatena salina]|nr:hypothetical protein [Halocatena salina]
MATGAIYARVSTDEADDLQDSYGWIEDQEISIYIVDDMIDAIKT